MHDFLEAQQLKDILNQRYNVVEDKDSKDKEEDSTDKKESQKKPKDGTTKVATIDLSDQDATKTKVYQECDRLKWDLKDANK